MEITISQKKAVVIGATGLVGSECLNVLLQSEAYTEVVSLSRKPIAKEDAKHTNFIVDFDHLEDYKGLFQCDDLFLCLGTTIKSAGSKDNFLKIDHGYNVLSAQLAKAQGAKQCILISAVGADENAMLFYNKVKGLIEGDIEKLNFWAFHILQPSILLGERTESRWLEKIGQSLGSVLNKMGDSYLGPYQPVPAEKVAVFMLEVAQGTKGGKFMYSSDQINQRKSKNG